MKRQLISIAVAAGMVLAATDAWALPPRQHTARGVIESIDPESRTLTLSLREGEAPVVFVWNGSTRFSHGWSRMCSGALHSGEPVSIYYRRELGQLMLRSVSLRAKEPPACPPASGCVTATCAPK